MKCEYKLKHPDSLIGEHHFHGNICCKCGLDKVTGNIIDRKELLTLRKEVW